MATKFSKCVAVLLFHVLVAMVVQTYAQPRDSTILPVRYGEFIKSEDFKFFHYAEVSKGSLANHTLRRYQTGGAFKPYSELEILVDEDSIIREATLSIDAQFIHAFPSFDKEGKIANLNTSPGGINPFAGDELKSFLAGLTPTRDHYMAVNKLVSAILTLNGDNVEVHHLRAPEILEIPPDLQACIDTYAGKLKASALMLPGGGRITFANTRKNNKDTFVACIVTDETSRWSVSKAEKGPTGLTLRFERPDVTGSFSIPGTNFKSLSSDAVELLVDQQKLSVRLRPAHTPGAGSAPLASAKQYEVDALVRQYRTAVDVHQEASACKACVLFTCKLPGQTTTQFIGITPFGKNDMLTLSMPVQTKDSIGIVKSWFEKIFASPNVATRVVDARTSREPDLGGSLSNTLDLLFAISGREYYPLINANLASFRDADYFKDWLFPEAELLAWVEIHLLLNGMSIETEGSKGSVTQAYVYDGRISHSINLYMYYSETKEIGYMEPWKEQTFLLPKYNDAGIDAREFPNQARFWLVSGEAIRKVLFAIIVDETDLQNMTALAETMQAEKLADQLPAYKQAMVEDEKGRLNNEERLNEIGYYYLQSDDKTRALRVFELNVALHPDSPNAHDSLGEGYLETGDLGKAKAEYTEAIKKLNTNTSLSADYKKFVQDNATKKLAQINVLLKK